MKRINEILADGDNVLIEVYSQYNPNHLLETMVTDDANKAIDFVLYYPNDYVYIRHATNPFIAAITKK